ncbi:MAG TPA: bifunctional diaminohydroxyphosphoribosylaminopyrimidine deaminase/5-amino-6-(5-phosphoribosylamino)uracil reductase RibD [Actinomycetales bacterium]|nr:bifunctional diaminohydroxyphosphoribosylaminopyrimidine deaminase/5-amino-6-(5-phosphoribosylamino)uracil reductase RibD [Actinomycetales bacterium]
MTSQTQQLRAAMLRALTLAANGPAGVNPRVGCVVVGPDGAVVGEGWHDGAGTPHAEVGALAQAGARAIGGTAIVTLEPCDHTGRTGPCSAALVGAGVVRVVYGRPDDHRPAAGGAARLAAAGVEATLTEDGDLRARCAALVADWAAARELGRPLVTWKLATSLDGRVAAVDGTSRWITSAAARADAHRLRAQHDTVLVGTGTVLTDDPALTVRDTGARPTRQRPLRAVMGLRDLPPSSQLARAERQGQSVLHLRTREPKDALQQLWDADRRQVLLEGGPTVAAAFWRAGLVDRVVAYVAPALLGAGWAGVGDLGITTIDDAARLRLDDVTRVGPDVRLTLTPHPDEGTD